MYIRLYICLKIGKGGNIVEENSTNNNIGIVKISDEVVSVIAGLAASEIEGVVNLSLSAGGSLTQMLSGKKNVSKGVKVTLGEDSSTIDVNVIVEYGVKIPEVADCIQESVKKSVESMTGLIVSAVNVYIQGIVVPKKSVEELDQI
jgi:uncharacterized alkaline shock family protein YloU